MLGRENCVYLKILGKPSKEKMETLQVMLVVVLVSSSTVYCSYSARQDELFPIYEQINHHLCDHVQSDDLEANMREAKRWYNDEVSRNSNTKLIEAVKLFISIDDANKCTRESFRIIEANDYLTYYAAHGFRGSGNKVVELVHHYAIEHATECLPKYPDILREKYKKVGELITARAHELTDAMIKAGESEYGKLLYKVVEKISIGDLDRKYPRRITNGRTGFPDLDEKKLREVYNKYVVDTCRKFVTINDDEWLEARCYDKDWVIRDETDQLMIYFTYRYPRCKLLIGGDSESVYRSFREEAYARR